MAGNYLCSFCLSPAIGVTNEKIFRCQDCTDRAVDDLQRAKKAGERVVGNLRRYSIWLDRSFPLRLHTPAEAAGDSSGQNVMGLVRLVSNGHGDRDEVACISVMAGLPEGLFEAILAHELVHVAIAEAGWTDLPKPVEEGLAEYVAWLYLQDFVEGPVGTHWAERIRSRQGDVYGDGFALVSRMAETHGFGPVWKAIRHHRNPWAGGDAAAGGSTGSAAA